MSTRSNIIIKKTFNDYTAMLQVYHHHDGYPSGVGCDLQTYLNTIVNMDDVEERDKILFSPRTLINYIVTDDNSYEIERGIINLHGDIEYLYVIDLDNETTACYSVSIWNAESSDEDFINGKADKQVDAHKESVLVYRIPFTDEPTDEDWEKWDSISNYNG